MGGGCFGELRLFFLGCSLKSASAGTRDEGVESVSERRRGAARYGGDALAPTDQLIF